MSQRRTHRSRLLLTVLLTLVGIFPAMTHAADLVTLGPDNYKEFAPRGKEARACFGDYVLRNDKITLAVADPKLMTGRSGSRWSIANVSGALIDLARLDSPGSALGGGDMLRAYYPAPFRFKPDAPNFAPEFTNEAEAGKLPGREPIHAKRVTLTVAAYEVGSGKMLDELAKLPPNLRGSPLPSVEVSYTLEDGWDYVLVEAKYTNPTEKPFTPDLTTTLRADDLRESGMDFGNQLFFIYDPAWNSAYGVLASEHALAPQKTTSIGTKINHAAAQKSDLVIAPGKTLTVTRRLIPARDVFQLKKIAAAQLERLVTSGTVQVETPDGPLADALVTATLDEKIVGVGRTDKAGKLAVALPAGEIVLSVAPFGQTPKSVKLPVGPVVPGQAVGWNGMERVAFPKPSVVAAKIVDEQGNPIASKIQIIGVAPTPTPAFFAHTGARAVGNLLYTENGTARQPLAPGKYRAVVTAGPEFDAVTLDLDIAAEKTAPLEATLKRVVNSAGWISADTHTHTAYSGPQDQFFVYPYTPCAETDGTSLASPLGRVLNLLCENIEFAPTADHNFITSFEPYLKELRAEGRMATVPGIGLTAGRRHAVAHQNSFPVKWIEGAQDGGAIQRPEHVAQITWLSQWYNSAEKIIQLDQPCGSPLSISPEVDVLELHRLDAIIEGKPTKNADDRTLDWVAALNKGFRIPAVATSHAYTNFHGAGGVRSYIQCSTDDPAKIDAMEIVRSLKRGKTVMTTGPFMQVSVVTPDKKEVDPPATNESLRAENGKVSLHVRVQSSNWAVIDRVQILVSGERLPALNFTRAGNAAMFNSAAMQFDQVIPIELKSDAHLIVVASGKGPDMRDQNPGREPVTHVAVSNPIFVDAGKKGYEPASPLEDKVRAELEFSRPVLARAGAPTGHVRLSLKNTSDVVSEDIATLITYPENSVKIMGDATKKYSIAPGGETFVEWELLFTPEFLQQKFPIRSTYNNAGAFGVRVERSDKAPGRRGAGRWMDVENPMRLLPPIADLDAVADAVKNEVPLLVKNPRNEQVVSELRMGVSGDKLAIHARVTDAKMTRKDVIWEGSCVEVFGAMGLRDYSSADVYGGYRAISQLFLLPKVGSAPDTVMRQAKDKIVPDPLVQMRSTPTAKGYEMVALIPLTQVGVDVDLIARTVYFGGQSVPAAVLGLEPTVGKFRMEVRVTAAANSAGDSHRGTLFRAGAPHVDHHDYGQFRLEAPVQAKVELITPTSFAEKAAPGKVRLTLTNSTAKDAAGKTSLRVEPEVSAKIVGEASRAFSLGAGKSESFEFEVAPASHAGTLASAVDFIVTRSADGMLMTTPALTTPLLDRPLMKVPGGAALKLEALPALVAKAREYKIDSGGVPIVSMRLAAAGDDLVVVADVVDAKVTQNATPWKGSCFEIFAEGPAKKITQIFLQPGAEDAPARALLAGTTPPAPATGVRIRTVATATGYQMQALIPFATLGTDAARPVLEFQITATDEKGKVRRGVLFGSPRAYQDTQRYGRFLAVE